MTDQHLAGQTSPPWRCAVVVLGSGPAGLFAADQLIRRGVHDVVVVEQGRPMATRSCPTGPACVCPVCDVLEGVGGAGSFSDGKITLSATRGTHGHSLFSPKQEALLGEVERVIRAFSPEGVSHEPLAADADIVVTADRAGLRFESYPLLHIGSDGVRRFGERYAAWLTERGVTLLTSVQARRLLRTSGRVSGVELHDARTKHSWILRADAVIAAVGLAGTPWLERELDDLGVTLDVGPADIGIRLETTARALEPFIGAFYDFKASRSSLDGLNVRSFCVNGNGFVVNEYHRALGIRGVNGHSFLDRRSGLSNLAILTTITPDSTPDPATYVREIAATINHAASGYPVRQILPDFMPSQDVHPPQGVNASNPKTRPGRLQDVLPPQVTEALRSYIRALGAAIPPTLSADTVLYAPEIKYYNRRVPLDFDTWETRGVPGLYVVGNAAGYTASLVAAALSGVIAGRALAARLAADPKG